MSGVINTIQTSSTTQEKSSSDTDHLNGTTPMTKDDLSDQPRPHSFTLEQTRSIESTSDDDFYRPKSIVNDDQHRPSSSHSIQNGLDETRRFGVLSPKVPPSSEPIEMNPSPSRPESRLSKHSTSIEPMSSREDTDRSAAAAPLVFNERSLSRKSSSTDTFLKSTGDTESSLIKPGEQLQIPMDTIDNERNHSPPPVTSGIQDLALINPLHRTEEEEEEQQQQSTQKSHR